MELKTLRGMRDFLPEEMIFREEAIEVIRKTFESFGFAPLETPILESLDILTLKSGEAIKDELYTFKDKGDRDVGLRFDLTVPLARIAASNPQLPKPFKRYAISRVYRYDEPQSGRFREFWQADVDILGTTEPLADATCVAAGLDALRLLGFGKIKLKVNSRKILNSAIASAGIGKEKANDVIRLIDKLEKIGKENVVAELSKLPITSESIDNLFSILELNGTALDMLDSAEPLLGDEGAEGCSELKSFLTAMEGFNLFDFCELDFKLARGLDYYNGLVFEVVSTEKDIGSLGGGGRYDEMIETYGGPKTPAVGFSLGIERILELLPKEASKTRTKVFIIPIGATVQTSIETATKLRSLGINCDMEMSGRKLGKSLEYAGKLGIEWALIVGEKDLVEGNVTLRNLYTGNEERVPIDKIGERF